VLVAASSASRAPVTDAAQMYFSGRGGLGGVLGAGGLSSLPRAITGIRRAKLRTKSAPEPFDQTSEVSKCVSDHLRGSHTDGSKSGEGEVPLIG
jgi:hypothetical protein